MIPGWIMLACLFGALATPVLVVFGIVWLRRAFVTGAELRAVGRSIDVERSRITAVDEHVDHLSVRVAAVEGRVGGLEQHNGEPPSRIDLSKDIGKVAERVRGLETSVDALKRIGETTNQYLHTMIEQGLRK